MSFGLRPYGVAPYGLINTPAQAYTMTAATGAFTLTGIDAQFGVAMPADTGAFTLTGQDVQFGIGMPADAGVFTLTGVDVDLSYTAPSATGGGLPARRKRRPRGDAPGNREFLGSLRNSRPGIAEEEMREVMATVRTKAVPIPMDAIEDDDEEAILWLL